MLWTPYAPIVGADIVALSSQPYLGPGDVLAATSWYGMRAYSNAVAGSVTKAIKIVDTQTGAPTNSLDITTLTSGTLDLATMAAFIAAHCSNNPNLCYVDTIYDQVGSNHWTFFTTNRAPLQGNAIGSNYAVSLAGHAYHTPNSFASADPNSASLVFKNTATLDGTQRFIISDNNNDLVFYQFGNGSLSFASDHGGGLGISASNNQFHAFQYQWNGNGSPGSETLVENLDGTDNTSSNALDNNRTLAAGLSMGALTGGTSACVGQWIEFGVWAGTAFSSGNRTALFNNQKNFWGNFPI